MSKCVNVLTLDDFWHFFQCIKIALLMKLTWIYVMMIFKVMMRQLDVFAINVVVYGLKSEFSIHMLCISLNFFSVKKEYSCVWRTRKEQTTGKRKLGWKKGKLFILLYIPLCLSKESSLSSDGVWWICLPPLAKMKC